MSIEARVETRGKREPTMADIAARAGVSRALVSTVFRGRPGAGEATRARILQVAEELGYRPNQAARNLASTSTRLLGVLLRPRNPFHVDLLESMYPLAEEAGYDIVISAMAPQRDERKALEALLGYRSEAVIVLGGQLETGDIERVVRSAPVIMLGRPSPIAGVDSITSDAEHGVELAIEHLTTLGHERIAFVGAPAVDSANRERYYRSSMQARRLEPQVVTPDAASEEESGARAALELLESPSGPPTAVFAFNDRTATGFIDMLLRRGVSIPEDVSVVGYDDSQFARLAHMSLTTIRQDAPRMAGLAIERAIHRANGESLSDERLVLEPELVIRSTTAPPRSSLTGTCSPPGRVEVR